jgi:hypothetical protein
MNNLGISWKVYAQSYAAAGGTVTTPDGANGTHYYRRHNGATWYSDILSNVDGSQVRIVDFSQFATDLPNQALPQFSIIAPDGINDGHDNGPTPADAFLSANLPALLAQPYFQPGGDGLLIVTFDNGDGDRPGRVYTAVIGPNVTPNTISTSAYKHENTLRTLLDALGITTYPGASASVTAMTDFFSGYVTVTSPVQNAVTSGQVLVSAAATEPAAQIFELQVWDATTGTKLGESPQGTSTISQTFSLTPGIHQLVVEDISTGDFHALHQAVVSVTVLADGVVITSPVAHATTGPNVLVSASATESTAQIYQLQVWDATTGTKLGESAPGSSTISQTFSLAPGAHKLAVKDISTGDFHALHRATVDITVTADGVVIATPAANASTGPQVLVTASATESQAQIYQLQVWDATTGTKLGESAQGTSTISQTFSLAPGVHQLVVEDLNPGDFQALHKAVVNITVSAGMP